MSVDVLIVTPDIVGPVKNGGIGTACMHYALSLAGVGISVDILFTGNIPVEDELRHWVEWYKEKGIGFLSLAVVPPLEKYTYGCKWYTERALRLERFLRSTTYRYVIFQDWHGNGFWTARAKRMAAAFSSVTIGLIAHSPNEWQREGMEHHGDEPFERADLEWVEREAIASVDVLISPSQHMIDWLTDHDYALPERVVRCPITFENEIHQPNPATFDGDHLIFFGRLESRKGLHLVGEALVEMANAGRTLPRKISLLGKNSLVNEIPTVEYIAQLRSDLSGVDFVVENDFGYAEAVDYIRAANGLVVIPSLLDNFPLTVVESITNGFHFIASAVGGIPEIADPALLFEPTVRGLMAKLLSRESIAWSEVRHPYAPAAARSQWIDHVKEVLASDPDRAEGPALVGRARPPVSVCVPVYHHDAYLRRMVTAFLREPQPEIQLVLVNDGTPPEDSVEFDELADLLVPAGHVFYRQENAGPGAARNKAVRLAEHEHILFFDADNVPFPGMLDRLLTAMDASGADSIAAPFAAVPAIHEMPLPSDIWYHFLPPGGSITSGLIDNTFGDATCLLTKTVFHDVGGFSTERQSWEDWEFLLSLVLRGHRHFVYPEPLLYYAFSPNGRNVSARKYHNRLNLLSSLQNAPKERLVEMVSVFARDQLKRLGVV